MSTFKRLFAAVAVGVGIGVLIYRFTHPVWYDGYDNVPEDETV